MDRDKIAKLRPLDADKYKNIGLDHLVVYAVVQLEKMGADLSFENTVVACFILFPKKFSLPGFSVHPDSARVKSCLSRCTLRTKQWLGGKLRQGFTITDRSRTLVREVEDIFTGRVFKDTKATSQTRRKEMLLAEVEISPAYLKYKDDQFDSISEADFCYLLQGTLDSSKEILAGNLVALEKFAQELQCKDITKFLGWLRQRFKNFLGGSVS